MVWNKYSNILCYQLLEDKCRAGFGLGMGVLLVLLLSACGGADTPAIQVRDVIAPQVVAVVPGLDSKDVAVDARIAALFNEDMFSVTMADDAGTFLLFDSGRRVEGSVRYNVIKKEADFDPARPLGLLKTYTATLSSDITDLAGNGLDQSIQWSFTSRDGAWDPAEVQAISTGTNSRPAVPMVAMDGQGGGMAVWRQLDGTGRFNIFTNNYDRTRAGWLGAGARMAPNLAGQADTGSAPAIVMDAAGNALVVWVHAMNGQQHLMSSYYSVAVGGWSPSEQFSMGTTEAVESPRVVMDAGGYAIAVWRESDGSVFNVWANRYVPSHGWQGPGMIESGLGSVQSAPGIAMDGAGNAVAAWVQLNAGGVEIVANRYAVDSTQWQGANPISLEDGEPLDAYVNQGRASDVVVAMDAAGNAQVVWLQAAVDSSQVQVNQAAVWAAAYDVVGDRWGGAQWLDKTTGSRAAYPHIAMTAVGDAVVVWQQAGVVKARHYEAGRGWNETFVLSDVSEGEGWYPQVVLDANGNAAAVWLQSKLIDVDVGTARDSLWGRRFLAAESSWQASAVLLEADDTTNGLAATLAIDATGYMFAVWAQNLGAGEAEIRVNRFE